MKQTSLTWKSEIKTGASLPDFSASDGESVAGQHGQLQIALSTHALRLQRDEPSPTYWLLPLDNPEVVRLSANLPGELLWLCPRRPQSLVGMLLGDFRGAWWEGGLAMIKTHDAVEVYFVPAETPGAGSLALLARIVALRWAGWPSTRIHAALSIVGASSRSAASTTFNRTSELALV